MNQKLLENKIKELEKLIETIMLSERLLLVVKAEIKELQGQIKTQDHSR